VIDESEAHSDTVVFQSAAFGRFEMMNNDEFFLSQRLMKAKPTPIQLFFNQQRLGDMNCKIKTNLQYHNGSEDELVRMAAYNIRFGNMVASDC
jgi:hypothetical protein